VLRQLWLWGKPILLAEVREMESNINREATMNPRTGSAKFSSVYLRLALGISFLSAVATGSVSGALMESPMWRGELFAIRELHSDGQLVFAGSDGPRGWRL